MSVSTTKNDAFLFLGHICIGYEYRATDPSVSGSYLCGKDDSDRGSSIIDDHTRRRDYRVERRRDCGTWKVSRYEAPVVP